jgi:hypothetical protein
VRLLGCYHGWAVGQNHRKRGVRGFDAHKRIRGRKRHILVDTLGIPIASRVEAANISDRRAAVLLLGGLGPIFPTIKTIIADAGHQSRKLTRLIKAEGYELRIVKHTFRQVVYLRQLVLFFTFFNPHTGGNLINSHSARFEEVRLIILH